MAIWTAIAAIVESAVNIGAEIANMVERQEAYEKAVARGRENLIKGQGQAALNYDMLAADQYAKIALSGVRADEGTAVQMQNQVHITKKATINKMASDFEDWRSDLKDQKDTADLNSIFNMLGASTSAVGTALATDWTTDQVSSVDVTADTLRYETVGSFFDTSPYTPLSEGGTMLLGTGSGISPFTTPTFQLDTSAFYKQ